MMTMGTRTTRAALMALAVALLAAAMTAMPAARAQGFVSASGSGGRAESTSVSDSGGDVSTADTTGALLTQVAFTDVGDSAPATTITSGAADSSLAYAHTPESIAASETGGKSYSRAFTDDEGGRGATALTTTDANAIGLAARADRAEAEAVSDSMAVISGPLTPLGTLTPGGLPAFTIPLEALSISNSLAEAIASEVTMAMSVVEDPVTFSSPGSFAEARPQAAASALYYPNGFPAVEEVAAEDLVNLVEVLDDSGILGAILGAVAGDEAVLANVQCGSD